jgi:hypothetical protein
MLELEHGKDKEHSYHDIEDRVVKREGKESDPAGWAVTPDGWEERVKGGSLSERWLRAWFL